MSSVDDETGTIRQALLEAKDGEGNTEMWKQCREVGTAEYCSPRQHVHLEPSFLELNATL